MTNKEKFVKLFQENIHREGSEQFLRWLQTTDFFSAPASADGYLAVPGGLVKHSLNMFDVLTRMAKDWKRYESGVGELSAQEKENIAVIGLLHAVGNVNTFYESWEFRPSIYERSNYRMKYDIEECCPYPQGERSVLVITQFMELDKSELPAIRYHMGFKNRGADEVHCMEMAFIQKHLTLLTHMAYLETIYTFDKDEN